jgi:hypothetical protein
LLFCNATSRKEIKRILSVDRHTEFEKRSRSRVKRDVDCENRLTEILLQNPLFALFGVLCPLKSISVDRRFGVRKAVVSRVKRDVDCENQVDGLKFYRRNPFAMTFVLSLNVMET